MKYSEDDLQAMDCSREEIDRIKRQHRGGTAGASGVLYEENYALYRLIKGMTTFLLNQDDLGVLLQDFGAVDDVVVDSSSLREYCQLKTSPSETWSANSDKLARQFRLQKKICLRASDIQAFLLRLVTPHPDRRNLLIRNMPSDLQDCTEVEFFEQVESFTQLFTPGGSCHQDLRELCAANPDSLSELEAILFIFLRYLRACRLGEICYTSSIVKWIQEQESERLVSIKLPGLQVPAQWKQVKALLGAIPGLTVDIDGGFCHYSYKDIVEEKGHIGHVESASFHRFVTRIIDNQPKTFEEFWEQLP